MVRVSSVRRDQKAAEVGLCWPPPEHLGDTGLERLLHPPALDSGKPTMEPSRWHPDNLRSVDTRPFISFTEPGCRRDMRVSSKQSCSDKRWRGSVSMPGNYDGHEHIDRARELQGSCRSAGRHVTLNSAFMPADLRSVEQRHCQLRLRPTISEITKENFGEDELCNALIDQAEF